MVNPNNVFFYRMTGNNTLDPLYGLVSWTSQGAADYTGQFSGYPVGTIINIQVDGQPWSQGGAFDGYTGPEGPASGDLAGNYPGPTVVGIQTIPVSSVSPTDGQVLTFSADFDQLQFITPASTVTFAGDLSGSPTDQTVVGIQTIPVDSTTPTNGQVLTFDADTSQAAWMTPALGVTFANDLVGSTATDQYVAAISGQSGTASSITVGNPTQNTFTIIQSPPTNTSAIRFLTISGADGYHNATTGLGSWGGGVAIEGGPGATSSTTATSGFGGGITIQAGASGSATHAGGSPYYGGGIDILSGNIGTYVAGASPAPGVATGSVIVATASPVAQGQSGIIQMSTGSTLDGYTSGSIQLQTGTASGGGTVGSIQLEPGLAAGLTVATTGVTVASLAGSGAGQVAVSNAGLLSWTAGGNATSIDGYPVQTGPVNGDILFFQGGEWNRRAIGSSGQVLTSFSGDPAWVTPTTGYELFNAGVPIDGYATLGVDGSTITLTYPSGIPTLHAAAASPPSITGITGDAAFTGTTSSGTITLDTVNSNTGSYGNSTHVGSFTVNGKGLITAASNVALPTSYPPNGTASGDLSGSYPSPTVAAIQGYPVSNSAPSGSNTFLWNSDLSEWVPSTLSFSGDVSGSFPDLTVVGIDGYSLLPVHSGYLYNSGSAMEWVSGAGVAPTINFQTSSYSLLSTDYMVQFTNSGAITCTFPASPATGQSYVIIVAGGSSSNVTFSGDGYYFQGTYFNGGVAASLEGTSHTSFTVNSQGSFGNLIVANSFMFNGSLWVVSPGLAAGGVTTSSGGTGINALTGDVTASGSGSVAATLATVNSNVGTFGSATQSAHITVNGKGLITAASNVTISGVAPSGTASGDLSGSYPSPTVAAIQGFPVSNSTPSSSNVLQWSGDLSEWVPSTLSFSAITALTGDVTASGSGSVAATLATVNSNVGSFGSTTQVGTFTVNGKGLITAASNATIAAQSITGITGDVSHTGTTASGTATVVSLTGSSNQVNFPESVTASAITLLMNSSAGATIITPTTGSTTGGTLAVETGATSSVGGYTGGLLFKTGSTTNGLGSTGNVSISTGNSSGSVNADAYSTGSITIATGTSSATTSAASGTIIIQTGTVSAGPAAPGNILLKPSATTVLQATPVQVQLLAGVSHNTTIQSGSTYQILQSDYFVELTNTSSCTVTLPSAPVTGQKHVICGSGSGAPTIIVESGGSGNISGMLLSNGALTFTTAGSSVSFQVYSVGTPVPTANAFIFNGTYWYVAPGF